MLRISKISFPGLGIGEFSVDSVAFTVFGIDIAWYALFICFGMICCIAYVIIQSKKIGITIDDVIDYALFTIPFGIVGARMYYVLSELDQYKTFWDIINVITSVSRNRFTEDRQVIILHKFYTLAISNNSSYFTVCIF